MLTPALNVYLLLLAFHLLLQSGDIESNPGPTNFGYETMVTCGEKIVEGLSRDPKGFALSLRAKAFIADRILQETNELNETSCDKARRLYSTVLNVVQQYPHRYDDFVEMLREKGQLYDDLLKELREIYKRKELNCVSGPAKQPQPSAIGTYRTYLNNVYNIKQLPADDKYPISCVEHFVNLECADVHKQRQVEEFGIHLARGNIDDVPRKPVTINQIACKAGDSFPKLVLIKGAPGVGKTTLSWELCRRWSIGELLTDYTLVVLLRLRDETVQEASDLVHLFQCEDDHTSQSVRDDLWPSQGRGVLFILEGLDELPQALRKDRKSIFMKLISGRLLPASTVLVTTRPWAVSDLPSDCNSRIDQIIEILGFTKEQIQEYVDLMIKNGAPKELQTYIDANPNISSAMYNPLQACLVVEVYREYHDRDNSVFPNTTTELYTAYSNVVIQRYLTDHPVEEEWNDELGELPRSLQPHFNQLCKIAYNGITQRQQQLVFFKKDVPDSFSTLGFMNSVHPLHRSVTRKASPTYNFLHFTLQEYLAAVYIWKNHSPHEQLILFETKSNEGVYKMVLLFLAGLTKLADPWTRCVLPVPKLGEEEEKVCNFSHNHILWLYESQNVELIASYGAVVTAPDCHCIWNKTTQSFFLALGYCLAANSFQVNLTLSYAQDHLYMTDMLSVGVKKVSSFPQNSVLKYLTIKYEDKSWDFLSLLDDIDIPVNLERLTFKEIHGIKLPGKFLDLLRSSNNLREINITPSNKQIPKTALFETLSSKPCLKKLTFMLSPSDDLAALSDFITKSSLEVLVLKFPIYYDKVTDLLAFITFGLDVNTLKQCIGLFKAMLPSELARSCLAYSMCRRLSNTYYTCILQDHTIGQIIATLKQFKHCLDFFSFESNYRNWILDCEGLDPLFRSITDCPSLKELYLDSVCSNTEDYPPLTDTLCAHTSLQTIHLSNCSQFLVSSVLAGLKENSSATKLVVRDFLMSKEQFLTVSDILHDNNSLQEIQLLIWTERWLDNSDLILLMKGLQANTHLEKLVIAEGTFLHPPYDLLVDDKQNSECSDSSIDLSASLAIGDMLQINRTLQYLELSFPLKQQEQILQPIFQSLCTNSILKTLILKLYVRSQPIYQPLNITSEDITAVGDMLAINKTLQVFHLLADISDCSPIFRGLSANKSIEELGFSETTKGAVVCCPEYLANRYRVQYFGRDDWLQEKPLVMPE